MGQNVFLLYFIEVIPQEYPLIQLLRRLETDLNNV